MSFIKSSTSFTRFRIIDPVPDELWAQIPFKLKQHAFIDIDDTSQERSFGWTNFDDMLDTEWHASPPEKADYLTFSLRLDTRRIPPAVLKKHTRLALRDEERKISEAGKKFITRERRKEITEQVKLRLMGRFLPIPAVFQVVWGVKSNRVYLGSTHGKVIEMFADFFVLSFDLHVEQLLPYALGLELLGEAVATQFDAMEAADFAMR